MAVNQITPGNPQLSAQVGQQAIALQGMNRGSGGNMQFEQGKDMLHEQAKVESKRYKEMQKTEQQITSTLNQNQSALASLDAQVAGALKSGNLELAHHYSQQRRDLHQKKNGLETQLNVSSIFDKVIHDLNDDQTAGSFWWHADQALKEQSGREKAIYDGTFSSVREALDYAIMTTPDDPEDFPIAEGLASTAKAGWGVIKATGKMMGNAITGDLGGVKDAYQGGWDDVYANLGGDAGEVARPAGAPIASRLNLNAVGVAAGKAWAEKRQGGDAIIQDAGSLMQYMQQAARAGSNQGAHKVAIENAGLKIKALKAAGVTNIELDALLDTMSEYTAEYAKNATLAGKAGEGAAAVDGTDTGGGVAESALHPSDRRLLTEVALVAEELRNVGTMMGDETLNIPTNTAKYLDDFGAHQIADVMAKLTMSGESPEVVRQYLKQMPTEFLDEIEKRIVMAQETARNKGAAMVIDKGLNLGMEEDMYSMSLQELRGNPAELKRRLEEVGVTEEDLNYRESQDQTGLMRAATEALMRGQKQLGQNEMYRWEDLLG